MEFKKITRISIFIDYANFTSGYSDHYKTKPSDNLWDKLIPELLNYYKYNITKNNFEIIEHTGTWLCVGVSDSLQGDEKKLMDNVYRPLDRKSGFIMKYGFRIPKYNEKTDKLELGPEKGVDAEVICQMLMGAFLNHYDSCILLSDDTDYIPAITRIQDYFGKKVIQAGFKTNSKIRETAFAHIPFESPGMNLEDMIMRIPCDVLFELDKAELDKAAISQIDFVYYKLAFEPKLFLTIHGHTDNEGEKEENINLSKKRAEAVSEYLKSKGIDEKRITCIGHGSEFPIVSNNSAEGRQKNRRVEFEIGKL